jgi:predicted PurR-regulated permease PerM
MQKKQTEKEEVLKVEKEYSFLDFTRFLPYIFFGFFIFLLIMTFKVYSGYLLSFFLAGIIYILFRKPHKILLIKLGARRNLAAAISTLIVLCLLLLPAILVLLSLVHEIAMAAAHLKAWLNSEKVFEIYQQNKWIEQYVKVDTSDIMRFREQIMEVGKAAGLATIKQGGSFFLTPVRWAVSFFLAIFILFFLFRSIDKIGPVIYRNLPFPDKLEKHIGDRMVNIFEAVVRGNFFISVLQGVVVGLMFWILGLPTPVMYGVLAGFFALIPVVGTMIIWLPGAAYLYATGSPASAVTLALICLLAYFLLENLLKPLLLDRELDLHPMFLFLAILGGLNQFGIKGLILGPFIVTLFVSVWRMVSEWNRTFAPGKAGWESETPKHE